MFLWLIEWQVPDMNSFFLLTTQASERHPFFKGALCYILLAKRPLFFKGALGYFTCIFYILLFWYICPYIVLYVRHKDMGRLGDYFFSSYSPIVSALATTYKIDQTTHFIILLIVLTYFPYLNIPVVYYTSKRITDGAWTWMK